MLWTRWLPSSQQGARYADPRRLRTDLRLPAADADDTDAECPSFARRLISWFRITSPPTRRCRCTAYRDGFGNWCSGSWHRKAASGSRAPRWSTTAASPIRSPPRRRSTRLQDLPEETLVFLLGSRYCETDRLSEVAWAVRQTPEGLGARSGDLRFRPSTYRVRLRARPRDQDRLEAFNERSGVCRDFAHLAMAFCRCMNIPARYCTGYLSDIGVPPPYAPMDFAGWFEAYLGGAWYTFDPRNNVAADRSRPDRPRPRCRRCGDQQHLRPQHADQLQGLDR